MLNIGAKLLMRILLNFVHEEDLYYYKCKYVYPGQSKSMTQCSLRIVTTGRD
jgi:hypothetical protein